MKVIFLDIDGVLCTPLSFRLNRMLRLPLERQRFDPLALFWLRWLTHRTRAAVVLSSSWRDGLMMMDEPFCRAITRNMFSRLAQNRTPIADVTPRIPSGDKSTEIAAWLSCTPCNQYIILDDNDCFASHPDIRLHWIPIPDSRGLRHTEALTAMQQLQNI